MDLDMGRGPTQPLISIIAAVSDNGIIGRDNELPWRLPADLRYFRQVTLGKPVLMGRRTYESLGRPLPQRRNIVITRDHDFDAPGCDVVHSPDEALERAGDVEEVMIIGGANLYEQLLARCGRLYLTRVHARVDGDVCFPPLAAEQWRELQREDHDADADNEYPYSFVVLERKT